MEKNLEINTAEEVCNGNALCGYGGWLSLFCVVQLFFAPVIVAVLYGAAVVASGNRIFGINLIFDIGNIFIVSYGAYAAARLRNLNPSAIITTKRFLISGLIWANISTIAIPFLLSRDYLAASDFARTIGLVHTALIFAIWFTYFSISRRVAATFPSSVDLAKRHTSKPRAILRGTTAMLAAFAAVVFYSFSNSLRDSYQEIIGLTRTFPQIVEWSFQYKSILFPFSAEILVLTFFFWGNDRFRKTSIWIGISFLVVSIFLALVAGFLCYFHFVVMKTFNS